MPMPSWATKDQQAWLTEYQQKYYLPLMLKQNYTAFWNPYYEAFAEKWPEHEVLVPGVPEANFTPDQKEELKKAIADRKSQKLMNWMRTHSRPKKPTTGTAKVPELLADEPDRRHLTPLEVFSKMFYKSHVKELAKAAAKKEDDEKIPATDPETTKKVMEECQRRRGGKEKEDAEDNLPTPDQIALYVSFECLSFPILKLHRNPDTSAIRRAPALLITALQHVQKSTQWSFTLLFGGPDPDIGGALRSGSIHLGKTAVGGDFGDSYVDFDERVMKPFHKFLTRVHPTAPDGTSGQSECNTPNLSPIKEPVPTLPVIEASAPVAVALSDGISPLPQPNVPSIEASIPASSTEPDLAQGTPRMDPRTEASAWLPQPTPPSCGLSLSDPNGADQHHLDDLYAPSLFPDTPFSFDEIFDPLPDDLSLLGTQTPSWNSGANTPLYQSEISHLSSCFNTPSIEPHSLPNILVPSDRDSHMAMTQGRKWTAPSYTFETHRKPAATKTGHDSIVQTSTLPTDQPLLVGNDLGGAIQTPPVMPSNNVTTTRIPASSADMVQTLPSVPLNFHTTHGPASIPARVQTQARPVQRPLVSNHSMVQTPPILSSTNPSMSITHPPVSNPPALAPTERTQPTETLFQVPLVHSSQQLGEIPTVESTPRVRSDELVSVNTQPVPVPASVGVEIARLPSDLAVHGMESNDGARSKRVRTASKRAAEANEIGGETKRVNRRHK
ncbi:hypothetical protein JVT61DRAFT_9642 [Boletus reticuloceps]|uniref:Uncharacterized protein n=1 Tax=Boletus reticuloceps TaxID=495285 RepID=A0A8I3A5L6_9AGAM|nr:hypothetical protein JVT61DRAFT_9642 [Boletus reticuloceps]